MVYQQKVRNQDPLCGHEEFDHGHHLQPSNYIFQIENNLKYSIQASWCLLILIDC